MQSIRQKIQSTSGARDNAGNIYSPACREQSQLRTTTGRKRTQNRKRKGEAKIMRKILPRGKLYNRCRQRKCKNKNSSKAHTNISNAGRDNRENQQETPQGRPDTTQKQKYGTAPNVKTIRRTGSRRCSSTCSEPRKKTRRNA